MTADKTTKKGLNPERPEKNESPDIPKPRDASMTAPLQHSVAARADNTDTRLMTLFFISDHLLNDSILKNLK